MRKKIKYTAIELSNKYIHITKLLDDLEGWATPDRCDKIFKGNDSLNDEDTKQSDIEYWGFGEIITDRHWPISDIQKLIDAWNNTIL